MPIPAIVWGVLALGGLGTTAKITHDTKEIVKEGDELFDSVSRLAIIAVTGYAVYKFAPQIKKALK